MEVLLNAPHVENLTTTKNLANVCRLALITLLIKVVCAENNAKVMKYCLEMVVLMFAYLNANIM